MISTNHLSYTYNDGQVFSFPDISLESHQSLLILGNSGKGKTTFLHLLAGLLQPKSGHIFIHNTEINTLKAKQRDQFRGQHIGLIFQKAYFIKALNIVENLKLAQQLGNQKIDTQKIYETLALLGIESKAKKMPSELSIGEQQRASIARSVMNKPKLILADEPTSALDDTNATKVAQLLENTARENNAALIIVTHDMRLQEFFPKNIQL